MLFGRPKPEDDTVVQMLASALRRDISFGVLRPDQKLKIDALRQSYGGSNHSMRETLRILVAEGMVEAESQRGFRVTSATQDDQNDILQMRLDLEKLGLERSLQKGSVDWEAAVIAAQHRLAHADAQVQANPDDLTALAWDEACKTFAETLIATCGSPRLIETASRIYNQSRRFRLALLREGRIDFRTRAKRQEQLKNAILARDTETALALQEAEIRADMI